MRMKIVTKTKISAKEMSAVRLTVNRSELFTTKFCTFYPASVCSVVFNSKGAVNKFDKVTSRIVHPTKGTMFALPSNVLQYINIVD